MALATAVVISHSPELPVLDFVLSNHGLGMGAQVMMLRTHEDMKQYQGRGAEDMEAGHGGWRFLEANS